MNLKDLVLPEKTISFDFPGFDDFKVDLTFLAKEEIVKLTKESTKTTYDKKSRQPVEQFDSDKFLSLYSNRVIKGWTGLKLKYLKELILINPEGQDLEAELEYTPENAELLLKNSNIFDNWVSDVTGDLSNFTKSA
jgi:hypothetical protein